MRKPILDRFIVSFRGVFKHIASLAFASVLAFSVDAPAQTTEFDEANSLQNAGHVPPEGGMTRDHTNKRKSLEQFALTRQGDSEDGHRIFFRDEGTKCATCHRVNKEGGSVGPDLSKIGGKFDRPHLIESLLSPSQQIVEGYRTGLIITKDGTTHTGIVKSRDDRTVSIVDASNRMHQIGNTAIDKQTEVSISLMPTGIADLLSPSYQ